MAWKEAGGSRARAATVSTRTITFGSEATLKVAFLLYNNCVAIDTTHIVFSYRDSGAAGKTNYSSVSGTTITVGTEETYDADIGAYGQDIALISTDKIAIAFIDDDSGDKGFAIIGDVAGAPAGTNMKINISDAWKDVELMKINIGDVWKDVEGVQINIGDSWKTVY